HPHAAMPPIQDSRSVTPARTARSERREGAELFESRIDLRPLERAEPLHAKLLAAKTPHYRTVDHGPAQITAADVFVVQIEALLREIADEASRETIAGAG